jgi:putative membrane protein
MSAGEGPEGGDGPGDADGPDPGGAGGPGHGGAGEGPGDAGDGPGDDEGTGSLDGAEGPGPRGSEVFDVGLQHERTALAWDRTALALIVVAALSIRVAGGPFGELLHLPGYLAIGLGAALLWFGARRYRHRDHDLRRGVSPVRPRLIVLTGIAAVVMGLVSLPLVLLA